MDYYHNNKIWFVAQVNKNGVMTNYLWYYDLVTKTFSALKDLQAPGISGSDNHHWCPIILSDDGHIIYVYDNVSASSHNKGIIIKRSVNPEDYGNFNTVYDGSTPGYWQAYPNLFKFPNGKIMVIWRGEPGTGSQYNNCGMFSNDGGQTWGSAFKIIEEINGISGITDPINYYIISGGNNKYLGLMVIVRNGSGGKFKWVFYYQTEDGQTWYNGERNFSKDVLTNGAITSQESLDHFLVDNSLSTTNSDYSTPLAVAIDDDGTPFIFYGFLYYVNGGYNDRRAFMVHFKNGNKTKIDISEFYKIYDTIKSYGTVAIARKSGVVDISLSPIDQTGNYYFLNQLRTYDYGQTFYLYRHKIISEKEELGLGYKSICMNLLQSNTKEGFLHVGIKSNNKYDLALIHLERKDG